MFIYHNYVVDDHSPAAILGDVVGRNDIKEEKTETIFHVLNTIQNANKAAKETQTTKPTTLKPFFENYLLSVVRELRLNQCPIKCV